MGIHTALNAIKMLPYNLNKLIFLKVGVIDNSNVKEPDSLQKLQTSINTEKDFFTTWAIEHHLNIEFHSEIGVDSLQTYQKLIDKILIEEKNCLFFGGRMVARQQDLISKILDFPLVLNLQNWLNSKGYNLVIIPMKIFT